jgi:NADP-dependent 3-hydroxy acid dehydrogenase YdfG
MLLNSAKGDVRNCIDAVCLDLGQSESLGRLNDRLEMTDILVNNAGAIPGGGLETLDDAQWRSA